MTARIFIPLAPGFEEMEVVAPVDILRRGMVPVDLVSTGAGRIVSGRNGIRLEADLLLADCNPDLYDLIYVPGGRDGVNNLKKDPRVLDILRRYQQQGKWIAAICAGPLVLAEAGVLTHSAVTSYPSCKEELVPQVRAYRDEWIVEDGRILTSRGPGCASEFGFFLLRKLVGESTTDSVAEAMLARR